MEGSWVATARGISRIRLVGLGPGQVRHQWLVSASSVRLNYHAGTMYS